jgi:hypothetical protein
VLRNGGRIVSRVLAGKSRATRAAALFVAAAIFNLSSFAPRAATPAHRHAGEVTIASGVAVDGSTAVQGQTFFSGSSFNAARESQSILSLDNLGRLELSEEAALRLDFDGVALSGALEAGRLRVYAPRGVAADFATPDARASGRTSAGQSPSACARREASQKSPFSRARSKSARTARRARSRPESLSRPRPSRSSRDRTFRAASARGSSSQ